jgi:hypothetical protein
MNDHIISQIEDRYSAKLPDEFIEFWRRGLCDVLAPGIVGQNYLWVPEMEWMPLEEIRDYKFPAYQNVCIPLLPFACDGAGDSHSFMLGEPSEMAVLWCPRDCPEMEIFAPDFLAAVFRSYLVNSEQTYDECLKATLPYVVRAIELLDGILPSAQLEILTEIYQREPEVVGKNLVRLLSPEERHAIEKSQFPDFDPQKVVRWSLD